MRSKKFILGVVAVGAATMLSLTACGGSGSNGDGTNTSTSTSTKTGKIVGPKPSQAVVNDLDGKTFVIPVNRTILLAELGAKAPAYTATVDDPTIAQYIDRYSPDGGVSFVPGIIPMKVGQTKMTLKEPGGNSVTFTLKVVAAA